MFNFKKRIKKLEEDISSLKAEPAREFYIKNYKDAYELAFENAKKEVTTYRSHVDMVSLDSKWNSWIHTYRHKYDYPSNSGIIWRYDNITFSDEDSKILESLMKNTPIDNLKDIDIVEHEKIETAIHKVNEKLDLAEYYRKKLEIAEQALTKIKDFECQGKTFNEAKQYATVIAEATLLDIKGD